jgi:hypothetical protein
MTSLESKTHQAVHREIKLEELLDILKALILAKLL